MIAEKGPILVGVIWAEVALALLFIGLRIYTRTFVKGKLGYDDHTLVATWLLLMAFAIATTVACTYGMGQHVSSLTTFQRGRAMLSILIGQFIVSLAIGMAKVVVSLFLMRIVTNKWHLTVLWFCIVSMMALSFLLSISVFAQVSPVEALWDPSLADQRKIHINLTLIAKIDCAWAAATDFFLAIVPWAVLWNLNMKRKEKYIICASLSLGVFAGICGVIRTTGLDALSQTDDYLYAISDSVIWTSSEVTTTIVCVCIPATRPLLMRWTGASSSGGYREYADSRQKGRDHYALKSVGKPSTGVSSQARGQYSAKVTMGRGDAEDSESDKNVLVLHGHDGKAITRSQEVEISYEDRAASASGEQISALHAV